MANLPVIRSREQIFGDLADAVLARILNVNDLNKGAIIVQFLDAISQVNFRSSAALIQMIDALSIDRANGAALQRLARDNNVPILSGTAATTNVTITDNDFQQISTSIYAGQPAPVAGSQTIYVADASQFAPTGSVYLGRGTPNVEGPLVYTGIASQAGGAYWAITLSATTLTTKFHNIGEQVVMAQGGNRVIQPNTTIQTLQGNNVTAVSFRTVSPATILDGAVQVTNVPVVCTVLGPSGNVPVGAISQVQGLTFQASCFNPQPVTNGIPPDTDDTLRQRIKDYAASKSLGTDLAISTAAYGVTSPDDLKTVTSATVVTYADNTSALVYDDGAGAEALFSGVGLETVVDVALGGEQDLQLRQFPVAQARVVNNTPGPYNIPNLWNLQVTIGGATSTHQFLSTDFVVPGAGTAEEVVVSINNDPQFNCYASTAAGGTLVVVYPKNRYANDITVNSIMQADANTILGFQTNIQYTLLLYESNEPLFQDGILASVATRDYAQWSNSIMGPTETLIYQVDNTPPITAQFTTAAFQSAVPGATMSASTPLATWVQVMNQTLSGTTAVVAGNQAVLTSNLGYSDQAALLIIGGTLLDKIFPTGVTIAAQGRASDYTLNLNTGQVQLTVPLQKGQNVYAGTPFSRANLITTSIPSGPTVAGNIWMVVDGSAELIPNDMVSNNLVSFTNVSSNLFTIQATNSLSVPQGFGEVLPGDWCLVWTDQGDSVSYPNLYNHKGFWRVEQIDLATSTVTVNPGVNSGYTNGTDASVPVNRIVFCRTTAPLQLLSFAPIDLATFATDIQQDVAGVAADIIGSSIRISSLSQGSIGQLLICASDTGGRALGVLAGQLSNAAESQLGFTVTQDSEAGIPNFNHSTFTAKVDASTYVDANYLNDGGTLDNFAQLLDRYTTVTQGGITVGQDLPDSNKGRRCLTETFDPTTSDIGLLTPPYMLQPESPIKANDRYFLRSSYQFDSLDTASLVIDGNTTTQAFTAEVARRVQVSNWSTPTAQNFSANDLESSLALSSPSSFYGFSFQDFKAWRQAQTTLTNGTYSVLIKAADWGPSGNRQRVGFIYPQSIQQSTLALQVTNSDIIDIGIVLPCTAPRTPNWDATTSFTVSVVTTGGKDQATYQWQSGTQPNFLTAGVQVGDVAIINGQADFLTLDQGLTALVTGLTATSFTISLPTGTLEPDQVQFSQMVNQQGTTTITTAAPAGVQPGQQIGIYGTASPNGGSSYPFNGTYFPTVINPTQFTIQTPPGVPGGPIQSGTWQGNVITITATAHGLQVGDVIIVSGVSVTQYNGTYPVAAVLNANQFQYAVIGSGASVVAGRFDFQSYLPESSTTVTVTSSSKSGQVVQVDAPGHGFTVGEVVTIQGSALAAWVSITTYGQGDLVLSGGQNYISLQSGNAGNVPSSSPTYWAVTTLSLNNIVSVTSIVAGVSFQYESIYLGNASSTGGTATLEISTGYLARSIGGSTGLLGFGGLSTTAQQVVDFLTTNAPGILGASTTTGSATITVSTQDLGVSSNYLSGTISKMASIQGSQLVQITCNTNVPPGSTITVQVSNPAYAGSYVVLSTVQSSPNYILTVQSSVWAITTGTISSSSGTFTGSTAYQEAQDGENWILSSDLLSPTGTPMFQTKRTWATTPQLGEEIRLICCTAEHVSNLWNQLVVTGLSNVSTVDESMFATQLQLTTDTFGSAGSVQITGGTANAGQVALIGSAAQYEDKVGVFSIPYLARRGLNARSWINLAQTTTQNKQLGFNATTAIQAFTTGLSITAGSGTFQTPRTTTADATTVFKIERHGGFLAIIRIAGTSLGLGAASPSVQEGDWVRLRNVVSYAAWVNTTAYVPGNVVTYIDGYAYVCLVGQTGQVPSVSPDWQRLGFNVSNQGIFQVVRTFGQDAFWIVNQNPVEEMVLLSAGSEVSFYSYDSVMPGDVLSIASGILGNQNVGQYTVLDNLTGPPGTAFPTATRIYTNTIPQASGSGIVLGDSFIQVNVLEQTPCGLWKRLVTIGPGPSGYAAVIVDTPNLMNKITSSLGAYAVMQGKLGFGTQINFGVDSYKDYQGLVKQLNTVIYGSPTDTIDYPGVRAAGSVVGIQPKLILPILVSLAIRLRTGIPSTDVIARVQSAVAGYVNTLPVGAQVSLSAILNAAQSVNGVYSAVLTAPVLSTSNDLIAVAAGMQAQILNPSQGVTVSLLASQ